jgi:hypothetical protein
MRIIGTLLSAAIAIGTVTTSASGRTGEMDFKRMDVPAWSALGLIDAVDQKREGAVLTTWFRFVDAPGRPPAEDDAEVVDAMRDGGHVDLRASIDCAKRRFRVEGTRIVGPDGTIRDVGFVPERQAFWVPLGSRTRASAAHAALCRRGRLR